MTPTGQVLSEILGRLDFAVLERSEQAAFRTHGTPPEWLADYFGSVGDPGAKSDFLADFLEQAAAEYWSAQSPGEPVRSGIWEETNDRGDSRHFEAIAMKIDAAAVLVIEAAGDRHDREQMFVQQWHVDTLDRRRLGKEIEKKEILLDCIVHDLSNPLSTIMVNLQHLGRKIGDENLQRSIDRALGQAERQRDLIRSIAEVFRSDLSAFDPISLDPADAPDLAGVASEIVDGNRGLAEERGIDLTLENRLPSGSAVPSRVIGEQSHLGRVFENLLANALRHSQEGKRVTVLIERVPETDSLEARIEDEGPGIDPDIGETIFKPFVQGREGTGQAGLGLYFCKLMIDLWGGEIGYRTRPEGGTCFWFRLPGLSGTETETA